MHLDDERVQRLIDGELSQREEASAREHAAGCADCRRRLEEAAREEGEVHALLRALDDPAPRVDARAVAARAEAGAGTGAAGAGRPVGAGRAALSGRLRWAAGIALALCVGGAAYAIPGSPLPALVHSIVVWVGGGRQPAPQAPAPAPSETAEPRVAGIAVAPGRTLVVLFTSRQPEGQVRVSLADGPEVVVRAPLGAATFNSDAERLVIDNHDSAASFDVEIPREAPWIEIRVAGDRLFLKDGPRVAIGAADPQDAPGPFVLSLAP